MPVTVESAVTGPYVPNGVTVAFPFAFKADSPTEVAVFDQDGEELSSALYSVELDTEEGGTVTFSVAPEVTDYASIYIKSNPAMTTEADFGNTGPSFNPRSLTRAIDRAAIRDLALKEEVDRSFRVPVGSVAPPFDEWAETFKGDPGGDGALTAPFTMIATQVGGVGVDIPSDIELVQTVGYDDTDIGSAVYAYDPAVDTIYVAANPRSSFLANDGRGFRLSDEQDITPRKFGAAGDGSAAATAFAAMFATASAFLVPAGAYGLATDVTAPASSLSWEQEPGVSFTGAGNILTPNLIGWTHAPNLKNIASAKSAGTTASPTTSNQAVSLIHKNSLTPDIGDEVNPAFAVHHNHYGTAGQSKAEAAFFETIVRTGGSAVIGEGFRGHCVVPDGIVGNSFGGIGYAYNGGAGRNAVGLEGYVIRGTSTDCPVGRSWTSADQLDGCFAATAQTKTLAVGGTGGKPAAAFYVNMFNTKAVQTGFWVPKSVVSGQTVAHTAFGCQELGLVYGLDLAKGSYSGAAIALPNNSPIKAYNAAGSAEHNLFYYGADDTVIIGQDAVATRIKGLAVFNPPASAGPGTNGELVMQATSNTSLTFKFKGSDGTVRSGSITLS